MHSTTAASRRHLPLALAAALAASLALAGCGGDGDKGADDVQHDWTGLTTALDSFLGAGSGQVLGYSFALKLDGKTVYTGANGTMSVDSVIPIASASKAPSATIILSLVKDGLIDLDTPVYDYIGSVVDWPIAKRSITMRMLLNHTSGIQFDSSCMNDDNTTLVDCVQEIADTTLNFVPGTAFGYSGAGYQVAGLVAEEVSGETWSQLVDERLNTPLGMTTFTYGDTDNPRIAGGASCSAEDYLKFTQLYLNGGKVGSTQIITADQAAQATENQVADLPVYYTPVPDGSGLNGYSFGFWISDAANYPGSNGPEISDPGLLGTTPWLDFDKSYTAVVLITSDTDTGIAMWNAARTQILDQLNGTQQ
ncbi:serine hydrolase domain-containing protein [Solimonas marina]|uniref:Beta-lactamase family protein n=1 Tax=Solimonas marina TaxID=2714601 RepID=A0A969W764_9GAMM|nr:serine hydrolase domain-containing protein [Solimonas marina]NKF20845.1 beta-lactamase family protein [Solimonas marina]